MQNLTHSDTIENLQRWRVDLHDKSQVLIAIYIEIIRLRKFYDSIIIKNTETMNSENYLSVNLQKETNELLKKTITERLLDLNKSFENIKKEVIILMNNEENYEIDNVKIIKYAINQISIINK